MSAATEKIKFHYITEKFYFRDRTGLKEFILEQFYKRRKGVESINFVFCDDKYLLTLNSKYLKHNTLTDIITFELSKPGEALLSDIYISVERIRDNAEKFDVVFSQELRRVIFHGVLHLLGYKDKTLSDAESMRAKEEEFLKLYSISRGTKMDT